VSKELTNATYLGKAVAILTTNLTCEVDLVKDGKEIMLVTVVRFSLPTGSTLNVKEEIATLAPIGEASFATLKARITQFIL
jgi:hypothetical protein